MTKIKTKNCTPTINIIHDDWKFELVDLINKKGKPNKKPWITFFTEPKGGGAISWDNEKFVKKMFKQLKRNNKGGHLKKLKEFIKEQGWDYEDLRRDLLEVYKISVKLKMW